MFMLFLCPWHDGSSYDYLQDSMARVQSVDDPAVFIFVGDVNAHHSDWLESVSPTDRHGRDALYVCNAISRVVSSWCAVPLTLLVTDSILFISVLIY